MRGALTGRPPRLPLLEERLDALLDVLGRERERELRAQEVERLLEGHVLLAVHRVLAHPHQQRRLRGELAAQSATAASNSSRGDDAVDEPDPLRLLRGDLLAAAAAARWSSCARGCGRSAP
jgi:hypothetical protein